MSEFVNWEIREIDNLRTHVEEHRGAREDRLAELAREARSDDDRYVDDFHELMRIGELAAELAIVALYRIVEIHRGQMLARAYPDFRRRDLERFDVLQALVMHTRKIDVSTLDGATEVNELREINNAVKHHAEVSPSLAALPTWKGKAGERLGDLRPAYERLRDAVPRYLDAFARAVDPSTE